MMFLKMGFDQRILIFSIFALLLNFSVSAQDRSWNVSLVNNSFGAITKIRFSDDNKYLLTGSTDGYVRLTEVRTQRVIHNIKAHDKGVTDVIFAKGGELLISSSSTGAVKLWELNTGREIMKLQCYKNGVKRLKIGSKDSSILIVIPERNIEKIKYWDIDTGEYIGSLSNINFNGTVFFGPEANRILTRTDKGLEYVHLLGEKKDTLLFFPPSNHLPSYSMSSDNHMLVIVDEYYPLSAWRTYDNDLFIVDEDSLGEYYIDKEEIKTRWELDRHRGNNYPRQSRSDRSMRVVEKSKDDPELVIVNRHFPVQIVDLNTMKVIKTDIKKIKRATISPDNKKILSIDFNGSVKLWNIETSQVELELSEHGGLAKNDYIDRKLSTIAIFSPDSQYLFISSKNGGVQIWNANTHQLVVDVFKSIEEYLHSIRYYGVFEFAHHTTFSNDGSLIAFSYRDELFIFNLNSFSIELRPAEVVNIKSSFFSPSGDWLMTSTDRFYGFLWNLHDLSYQPLPVLASINFNFKTVETPNADDILASTYGSKPSSLLNLDSDEKVMLSGHKGTVIQISFDRAGDRVITASLDSTARVWDSHTGELISELKEHKATLEYAELSFNGKLALTVDTNDGVIIWDADQGKHLYSFKSKMARFSPDGEKFFCLNEDGISLSIYSTQSGGLLRELRTHTKISQAVFHPDGKTLFTYLTNDVVARWSLKTGKISGQIRNGSSPPLWDSYGTLTLSHSADFFATISDGEVKIWNSKDLNVVSTLTDPEIKSVNFAPDDKRVITLSYNGETTIWDWKKEKQLASLTYLKLKTGDILYGEGPEFLWLDKKNQYYYASKGATSSLYFQKGTEALSFDQLDVRYNRPDKVLQAINSADTYLIEAYKKAYEKRIAKLKIDTTRFDANFSVPQAEILNANQLSYNQTEELIEINLKFESKESYLSKVNILVNGVPVYGLSGIAFPNRNRLDTTIQVRLSDGRNQIEAIALNSNGVKSYKKPLIVKYANKKPAEPKVYFVGLGIDKYKDPSNNLSFSAKDIKDLANAFKEKYGELCIIDTLLNESITRRNINQLKKKLLQTTVNDKVIVAYAGHGLLSEEMNYYLTTYETNFDSPKEGGLLYEELESLLEGIPARQKLLLVDACHSGEVDAKEMKRIDNVFEENKNLVRGAKRGVTDPNGSRLGLTNTYKLMQQIFINISNDIGATVISAASGDQFARETKGNGVFTGVILDYMRRQDSFTVGQLKSYVSTKVEEITNGLQQPTSRLENLVNDWLIWN